MNAAGNSSNVYETINEKRKTALYLVWPVRSAIYSAVLYLRFMIISTQPQEPAVTDVIAVLVMVVFYRKTGDVPVKKIMDIKKNKEM